MTPLAMIESSFAALTIADRKAVDARERALQLAKQEIAERDTEIERLKARILQLEDLCRRHNDPYAIDASDERRAIKVGDVLTEDPTFKVAWRFTVTEVSNDSCKGDSVNPVTKATGLFWQTLDDDPLFFADTGERAWLPAEIVANDVSESRAAE